jgi:hypothetical protein
MKTIATIAALALVSALPAVALAADAASPRDGDTVASRPQFAFDFSSGAADVQLSTSPDVTVAGSDVGAFVDTAASDFLLVGPSHGLAAGVAEPWSASERIPAGRYFWHVKPFDAPAVWGPVRTLTVRDEPILFEGWTARATRGRTLRRCARVLAQGTIAWSDNARARTARYSVRVTAGGRTVRPLRSAFNRFDRRFAGVACTRATRLRVTVALRDPAGHLTVGPAKERVSLARERRSAPDRWSRGAAPPPRPAPQRVLLGVRRRNFSTSGMRSLIGW